MTEIAEEDWEVVKHRVESMPAHIKLALGSYGSLSRDDMLTHLEKRDAIGRKMVEMQIGYLKFFKREMEKLAHEQTADNEA
ncbi:MAG: hypothetical protein HYX24_04635 [Candidatus Aenigmarchaeota archaeon]|nr:hypothetical protein [Candidatus Aenigmarchaeota archaeon]